MLDNVELLEYRHELDIRSALNIRTCASTIAPGARRPCAAGAFVAWPTSIEARWMDNDHRPATGRADFEIVSSPRRPRDQRQRPRATGRWRAATWTRSRRAPSVPGHRGQGPYAPVEPVHRQGGAHARLPRRGEGRARALAVQDVEDYIEQVLAFDVTEGETVRVEKIVAFYTSHDQAINSRSATWASPSRATPFRRGAAPPRAGLRRAVRRLDLQLPADDTSSACCACTLHRCWSAAHTTDHDAGVPAPRPQRRGLSAGHILPRTATSTRS